MENQKLYGISHNEWVAIGSILAQHKIVDAVVLYGSRAKETYKAGSDIDLCLFGKNISLEEQLRIDNDLDDLMLPYKIDLSRYHAINNEDLTKHIDRVGKTVYQREK